MENKKIILFGSSGFIGRNLYEHFSAKGDLLAATHYNTPYKNTSFFDFENFSIKTLDVDLSEAGHAIICSAITKPDECKKNPEKTYKINVSGTKNLINQLWEHRIFPIWFSSEYVFNGEKGNYLEEDKTCPNTFYGKHKSLIENFLIQSQRNFLALRLGKVFSLNPDEGGILTSTFKQLKNNKFIKSATDQIFSPIYIKDLCEIVDVSISKKLNGLYNVASHEFFSRYELTNLIKQNLGIKEWKVLPCSIKDFHFEDNRPLNTSLNPEKLARDTGFNFTPISKCINELEKIML